MAEASYHRPRGGGAIDPDIFMWYEGDNTTTGAWTEISNGNHMSLVGNASIDTNGLILPYQNTDSEHGGSPTIATTGELTGFTLFTKCKIITGNSSWYQFPMIIGGITAINIVQKYNNYQVGVNPGGQQSVTTANGFFTPDVWQNLWVRWWYQQVVGSGWRCEIGIGTDFENTYVQNYTGGTTIAGTDGTGKIGWNQWNPAYPRFYQFIGEIYKVKCWKRALTDNELTSEC